VLRESLAPFVVFWRGSARELMKLFRERY
jgi:hypothetical protein